MTWFKTSKTKPIDQKLLKEFFSYRNGYFIRKKNSGRGKINNKVKGSKHHTGYLVIGFFGKTYAFHRLVWVYHYGDTTLQVDHINNVKTDNRIENLRLATPSQNLANCKMQKNNKSTGFKNIYFCKKDKLFYVQIQSNGVRKKYGFTKVLKKALETRDKKIKELSGVYGRS